MAEVVARTLQGAPVTSALPQGLWASNKSPALFDHLIGERHQSCRYFEAD